MEYNGEYNGEYVCESCQIHRPDGYAEHIRSKEHINKVLKYMILKQKEYAKSKKPGSLKTAEAFRKKIEEVRTCVKCTYHVYKSVGDGLFRWDAGEFKGCAI